MEFNNYKQIHLPTEIAKLLEQSAEALHDGAVNEALAYISLANAYKDLLFSYSVTTNPDAIFTFKSVDGEPEKEN